MPETDRPGIALALLYRDRFRVDGQVRHLPRRPRSREVHGRSDQAEHFRFSHPGFRDGSRQRRPVLLSCSGGGGARPPPPPPAPPAAPPPPCAFFFSPLS